MLSTKEALNESLAIIIRVIMSFEVMLGLPSLQNMSEENWGEGFPTLGSIQEG